MNRRRIRPVENSKVWNAKLTDTPPQRPHRKVDYGLLLLVIYVLIDAHL